MSNHHSSTSSEPSDRKVLVSALGWLGVIAIFAIIVLVAYMPNREESFYQQNADQRFEIKSEVDSQQAQLVENYSWENQNDGVVRLPVVKAMELTVAELQREQGGDSVRN